MTPEELAEGRRLLGVLFKSAFSNYEENVESWVQWVREHSGRLLEAAERTQKAEAERDQARAEVEYHNGIYDASLADLHVAMGEARSTVAQLCEELAENAELKAAARALLVRTKHMRWTENRALEELL